MRDPLRAKLAMDPLVAVRRKGAKRRPNMNWQYPFFNRPDGPDRLLRSAMSSDPARGTKTYK